MNAIHHYTLYTGLLSLVGVADVIACPDTHRHIHTQAYK